MLTSIKRVLKIMPEKELRLEVRILRFNDSKTSHSFTIVSVLLLHVTFTTTVLSPMNVTFSFNHPTKTPQFLMIFFSLNDSRCVKVGKHRNLLRELQ